MVGFQTSKRLLLNKNTTDMAEKSQSLSYNECSVILPKFTAVGLRILIQGSSAIIGPTACCYVVTTLEISLFLQKRRTIATPGDMV